MPPPELTLKAEETGADGSLGELAHFLRDPKTQVVIGRALYPRFYAAGEGEPLAAKIGYQVLDYPRTVFQLASNKYNGLVILRTDQAPDYLPNAADVIVAGCMDQGYLEAQAVGVLGQPGAVYLTGEELLARCPTSTSQVPRQEP